MRALFSLPFRLLRRLLRGLMLRTVADMRGGRKRYAKEALLRDIHEYVFAGPSAYVSCGCRDKGCGKRCLCGALSIHGGRGRIPPA